MLDKNHQRLLDELTSFKEFIGQNNSLKPVIIGGYKLPNNLEFIQFLAQINSSLDDIISEKHPRCDIGFLISTDRFLHDINSILSNSHSLVVVTKWSLVWHSIINRLLKISNRDTNYLYTLPPMFCYKDIDKNLLGEWLDKIIKIDTLLAIVKNIKAWHFDGQAKKELKNFQANPLYQELSVKNVFREPSERDRAFVKDLYEQNPVPGYTIKSIRVIFNIELIKLFASHLNKSQQHCNNPTLISSEKPIPDAIVKKILCLESAKTKAELEQKQNWREKTRQQWIALKESHSQYTDHSYPNINILAVWHGLKDKAVIESIAHGGFIHGTKTTDPGYFGKAYYFTPQLKYAAIYAKRNAATDEDRSLLLSRVCVRAPFPVIIGDGGKPDSNLFAKGTPSGFDSVFIPVIKDYGTVYKPPPINYQPPPEYIELGIFEAAACLPQFEVTLSPS